MKNYYTSITFIILSAFCFAQTVALDVFGPVFSNPVEITHAGDDRLFIVEQQGSIKILNADGTVNATTFLNIEPLVNFGAERGLLGLAFAPNYNTTGRFYVNYINTSGDTVIARYTVSADPNIANTTATILLTISQPFSNHNGGKITFGPDGYLYIATGDGGSGGDPGDRSQNPNLLLGKLLRIDVSGATYTIPADNPYATTGGAAENYAIGLRNPWKLSFDSLTGDLWIADVGQNAYEEINKVINSGTPGDNYGWRCYEANTAYNTSSGNCPAFNMTVNPVANYDHSNGKCSITGGYLYRGTMYPNFYGKYFFADYCSNEIGMLTENTGVWNMNLQTPNITQFWTTFGQDINGELYIAGNGRVYKLSDPNLSISEENYLDFNLYPNPSNDQVNISLPENTIIQSVTIYTIKGEKIKTISPNNTRILSILTNRIPDGIYLVEIVSNTNKKAIRKLIIN